MKIVINNTEYTQLQNLAFGTNVDITGNEIAINQFTVDIKTSDTITVGQYAILKNGSELWAKYWITDVRRYTAGILNITCQSDILVLDRSTLPAVMYSHSDAKTVIESIFTAFGLSVTVASALANVDISGYCPVQTARQRLQWICFVAGAYIQTEFTTNAIVNLIDDNYTSILNDKVYYRPTIEYTDYVTAVRIYKYAYTQRFPSNTEQYVIVNDVPYVYMTTFDELDNPDADQYAPENIIEISGISLINENNFAGILSRMALYYFKRVEVTADVINNGEFLSGKKYCIDMGTGEYAIGYIKSCEYSFGHRHKTTITLSQAEVGEGVKLTVRYMYDTTEIGKRDYFLPSSYIYSIQNPYLKISGFEQDSGETVHVHTLYRPVNSHATGTLGSVDVVNEQQFDKAIIIMRRIASVLIVDEVSEEDGVVSIE